MNKTDTNTIHSRESVRGTRGRPLQRLVCDGHELVLCIEPYERCVNWVQVS